MAAFWLTLWLAPLLALLLTFGPSNVFSQIAIFFSKMAMVTFGGAYAVLAYVAQQAVETYGWLQPGEMLDGLGMAETTPGPLIMVLQFVGFMAAFRDAGALSPLLAGTLGGLLATWVTFAPCFLWIFLGAPYIEVLRGNRSLSGGLDRYHRRRGRRDPEPGDLVRNPHDLQRCPTCGMGALQLRCAGMAKRRSLGAAALGRSHRRDVPVRSRDAADIGRDIGNRHCSLLGRHDRMKESG